MEKIVSDLSPSIERLVFRLTGYHSEIQDIVQEVFLNIQKSAASFRGESSVQTWAHTITIHCCRAWQRQHYRRLNEVQINIDTHETDPGFQVPFTDVEENDADSVMHQLIAGLPADQRELIVLRYLEEWTLDELAEFTGVRKNTLEVRLHRIRHALHERYQSSQPQSL